MRKLTIDNLYDDLLQWVAADVGAVNEALAVSKDRGWEQWCVVQFLRWQHHQRSAERGVNYQRELSIARRRYDIAYNCEAEADAGEYPVLLTQWKAMKGPVSYDMFGDIGTLTEVGKHWRNLGRRWVPVLVGLSTSGAEFPGVKELPGIPNAQVRVFVSTEETWERFRNAF
ncbi:hypothetical protein [Nocardia sp. NPDC127526]|uniref:hypothetical protein n=1 Tax=Nocardia sp. NPDC127526 TaxID=3345393 RepID=UPI003635E854